MDKLNLNKLTMMRALLSFMQKNQAKWQNIGPIAQLYYQIYNCVEQIDAILVTIEDSNGGELNQKQNLQLSLIEDGFELVSFIYAYAVATNNVVLKGKSGFPISELRNQRDGKLSGKIESILELVVGHESELDPYGATQDKINNLRNLNNQYKQQLPKTRNNVSEKKSGNEKVKQLMKTASDAITEQLDKLMLRFKKEDPTFYVAYTSNRKVVDYGKRYEKPAEPEEKQTETVK